MDGKGRWMDNVFIERLWWSVKYQDVYLKAYSTIYEARQGLREYFEFYNSRRRHQSLDRRTPDDVYWNTLPKMQVAAWTGAAYHLKIALGCPNKLGHLWVVSISLYEGEEPCLVDPDYILKILSPYLLSQILLHQCLDLIIYKLLVNLHQNTSLLFGPILQVFTFKL